MCWLSLGSCEGLHHTSVSGSLLHPSLFGGKEAGHLTGVNTGERERKKGRGGERERKRETERDRETERERERKIKRETKIE